MNQSVKRIFTIGLIGGIACGKTYVADQFEQLGAARIDADAIASEVLARPLVIRRLAQLFGPEIITDDGQLDRGALARLVFGGSSTALKARALLEETVHPLIHARAVQQIQRMCRQESPPKALVIDAPLLIEAKWEPMCDAIVFVDTSEEVRLQRARQRGWDEADFRARETSQLDLETKRRHATHIIRGDLQPEELRRQLNRILEKIDRVN